MRSKERVMTRRSIGLMIAALAAGVTGSGCKELPKRPAPAVPSAAAEAVPTEKAKASFARYVIEPPDILLVDVIRAVPKPPYLVQPLDALSIVCPQAYKEEPIAGVYPVSPDGRVMLGVN